MRRCRCTKIDKSKREEYKVRPGITAILIAFFQLSFCLRDARVLTLTAYYRRLIPALQTFSERRRVYRVLKRKKDSKYKLGAEGGHETDFAFKPGSIIRAHANREVLSSTTNSILSHQGLNSLTQLHLERSEGTHLVQSLE